MIESKLLLKIKLKLQKEESKKCFSKSDLVKKAREEVSDHLVWDLIEQMQTLIWSMMGQWRGKLVSFRGDNNSKVKEKYLKLLNRNLNSWLKKKMKYKSPTKSCFNWNNNYMSNNNLLILLHLLLSQGKIINNLPCQCKWIQPLHQLI